MGAADQDLDERPVHQVYVSEFLIGRYPVTQDEYAKFIAATGHPPPAAGRVPRIAVPMTGAEFAALAADYVWRDDAPPSGRGAHPVVLVAYEDVVAYCQWLSGAIDRDVRLPTEAEWEKAARGGVDGRRYPWGDEQPDASRGNSSVDPPRLQRGTRPTGTYAPNGYGLYDVAGNVWEWVSDWYDAEYYGAGAWRDPRGPSAGWMRTVRGGAWTTDDPRMLRCACRHPVPPDTYAYSIGFRIVCSA